MVTNGTKFLLGACPNSDRRSATRLLATYTKCTFSYLYLFMYLYLSFVLTCTCTCILSTDAKVHVEVPGAASKADCSTYKTSKST